MERRHLRHAVDRPAKIYLEGGEGLVCRIRDVAQGGAKIRISGQVGYRTPSSSRIASPRLSAKSGWSGEKPPPSACALPTRDRGRRRPSPRHSVAGRGDPLPRINQQLSLEVAGEEERPFAGQKISKGPILPFGAFCMRRLRPGF